MAKSIFLPAVVCAVFFTCTNAQQMSWPQFRGPNSSGLAIGESSPPVQFGTDRYLDWKTDIPPGSSSPVIFGDNIYLTGYLEEKKALLTLCINRVDGSLGWCDSIFPENIEQYHAISSPAQSTPAVDEDGVYVYFASCGLKCYDHDGKVKWDVVMMCPSDKKWGNPVSPVVIDEMVILNLDYGGEDFRRLLALDKLTGATVWKTLTYNNPPLKHFGSPGFSTPVRFEDQVVVHKDGGIAAFSLEGGQPVWWLPIVTNGISTPLVYNEQIFVTSWVELTPDNRGDYFDYSSFDEFLVDFDRDGDHLISRNEFPEQVMLVVRPEIMEMEETQHSLIGFYGLLDSDKNDTINTTEWDEFAEFVSQYMEDLGLMAIAPGKKGELTRDDISWHEIDRTSEVPSPVAWGDCVYMLKNGGWLTCMDSRTGKIHYQERIGGPGAAIASPVIANGYLYLAAYNGTIQVVKAGKSPQPRQLQATASTSELLKVCILLQKNRDDANIEQHTAATGISHIHLWTFYSQVQYGSIPLCSDFLHLSYHPQQNFLWSNGNK